MTQHFVLDKALILDRLGGDEEIFAMMVDLYLQDVDNYVQALSSALALAINSANSAVLSREAHTVKGLLATFSDDAGAETAFTIERQAKAGDLSGLQTLVTQLQENLQVLATVLRSEVSPAG
jgi:HPt (histidine-containing phosphotransfer) domain-containing protein